MTTIDTGTGTQANQAIATAQSQLGTTVPNSKWCANFVSSVFKSAGLSSVFSATSSVPALVAQFSGKTSTNISTAQPGDLIVFGNNEHVMMYEGSSQVIGTATNTAGVTKVIETNMNNVITDSGKVGPSLVLHTGLDNNVTADHSLASFVKTYDPADYGPNATVSDFMTGIYSWIGAKNDQPNLGLTTSQLSWLQYLGTLPPNTPISQVQVPQDAAQTMVTNLGKSGFQNWWGGVDTTQGTPIVAPTDIAGALSGFATILGKFTNPSNWLHLGAMVVGVGLVGFGMWTVTKDLNETGPQGLVSPMPIILKNGV